MVSAFDRPERWVLACGALAALLCGAGLTSLDPARLPQVPGEDVVALVLGDARQQVSQALYDKVEEYFHGGVKSVLCEHGLLHDECEHGHGHEHGQAEPPPTAARWADPWAWLNRRVHVQDVHRHLEGRDATELLPWVWAACRASPRNTQAYLSGAYVLSRMVERPLDAVRLLEEGVQKNPADAELDASLGELWLNRLHDPARAEACFDSALTKWRPATGEAAEEAAHLKLRILFYLGYLAKSRGDVERLRACAREAAAINPAHVCAVDLKAFLAALEQAK